MLFQLLEMSLSGGVMILLTLLIRRALGNFLPRRVFPALWGLAMARLLLPFWLPALPMGQKGAPPAEGVVHAVSAAREVLGGSVSSSRSTLLPGLSLFVSVLFAVAFLAAYIHFLFRVRHARPVENEGVRVEIDLSEAELLKLAQAISEKMK